MIPDPSEPPHDQPAKGRSIVVPMVLACVAAWIPYSRALIAPVVVLDDYEILAQSWTWEKTIQGLWISQNEHVMPLGRLLTFVLDHLAVRLTFLPTLATLVGPVGLLGAMLLVYVFVRREMGHPLYGLLAVVLFGVSSVYHQAIYWFAASFSVLALDTLLLGLLAAQALAEDRPRALPRTDRPRLPAGARLVRHRHSGRPHVLALPPYSSC